MRALLILIPLLLVGCTNEPDEPLFPLNIKQVTNLKCDSESGATLWIVLDHSENLWISSSDRDGDSSSANYFLNVEPLMTKESYYGFMHKGKTYMLDRRSLVYGSYTDFQCAVTGELENLRSLGLEENRIKI